MGKDKEEEQLLTKSKTKNLLLEKMEYKEEDTIIEGSGTYIGDVIAILQN